MLTDCPPGPRRAVDVDLQVVRVDVDVDVLGLGQHGDGRGRRVDAALRLGHRDALHAVRAALELEDARRAVALDGERVLAVADLERLGLEPAALGVLGEHPEDVAGPEAGLVAARAALDLDDDVLVVVGVVLDHREADLLVELLHPSRARSRPPRASRRRRRPRRCSSCAPSRSLCASRHSVASFAAGSSWRYARPGLGVALAVPDDLGVAHLPLGLGEARLDLLDELLDHRLARVPGRGARGRPRPRHVGLLRRVELPRPAPQRGATRSRPSCSSASSRRSSARRRSSLGSGDAAPAGGGHRDRPARGRRATSLGLATFYRAAELGPISIAAAIGATGHDLPVIFGLATGDAARPSPRRPGSSSPSPARCSPRSAAAPSRSARGRRRGPASPPFGFGGFLIALPEAAEDGTAWALLDARIAVVVLLVAGDPRAPRAGARARRAAPPPRRPRPAAPRRHADVRRGDPARAASASCPSSPRSRPS